MITSWRSVFFRFSALLALFAAAGITQAQPDNDSFVWREPITSSDVQVYGYDLDATVETGEPAHSEFGPVKGSIWWTWRSPGDGFLTLFVNEGGPPMVLAAYTGDSLDQLVRVGRTYLRAPLQLRVKAGVAYQIAFGATADSANSLRELVAFKLQYAPLALNDMFVNSTPLPAGDSTFTGTLIDVSREAFEQYHSPTYPTLGSVWWSWRPDRSGWATIDRGTEYFRTVLAAYEGEDIRELRPLASVGPGWLLRFPVQAGHPYRIVLAQAQVEALGMTTLRLTLSELHFEQPLDGASFPPGSGVPVVLGGIPNRPG